MPQLTVGTEVIIDLSNSHTFTSDHWLHNRIGFIEDIYTLGYGLMYAVKVNDGAPLPFVETELRKYEDC